MTNRSQRRAAKFNGTASSGTTKTPNSNTNKEPLVKNNIWTRVKTWFTKTAKTVATFTKGLVARVSAAFRRIALSKSVKAVAFVIPSIRRFLRNCVAFTALVLSLAGMIINPIATFLVLTGAYLGFLGMAWVVGKLDYAARRGSRAANIVLDVADVVAKAVVITLEVGMGVLLVVMNAASSAGLIVFKIALVGTAIGLDVVARKAAIDYKARVDAAMPDADITEFRHEAGIDPFAVASSNG